jgi:hypothetical protein
MGQYATPSDLIAETLMENQFLVHQFDRRRARTASAALDNQISHRSSSTAWSGSGSVGYNQSLRVTAAMAVGVTTKLWSLTDRVQVIEEWEVASGPAKITGSMLVA